MTKIVAGTIEVDFGSTIVTLISWNTHLSLVRRQALDAFPLLFSRLQHAAAAADYGSFRPAAHALSMKQSTLSRSVQLAGANSIFGKKGLETSICAE